MLPHPSSSQWNEVASWPQIPASTPYEASSDLIDADEECRFVHALCDHVVALQQQTHPTGAASMIQDVPWCLFLPHILM